MSSARLGALLVLLLPLAACGGAAYDKSPAPVSPQSQEAEPGAAETTAEEPEADGAAEEAPSSTQGEGGELSTAEAELTDARRVLDELFAPQAATGGAAGQPQPSAPPAEEADEASSRDNRCSRACRAFASLERAAKAVCRLAGEEDYRCEQAMKLVRVNRTRVVSCGCFGE